MEAVDLAKSIVNRLVRAGFIAYFAGGWVRDHVMGRNSDDIDIATNASPAQIMDLFPGTNLVGLQFGVVIVTLEGHMFEVASFRKDLPYHDGRHPEGVEMGTPHEDAFRRDFTINGMFYDPIENVIHDYVNGIEDIKKGIVRTIGNPHERFHEDRLRMLRAFRFEARFGFKIDEETQAAIRENASTLFPAVAMERVWQEFNKMSSYPGFDHALIEMHRLGLLDEILPELGKLHIDTMKQYVSSFTHFPKDCPTILFLMELFPEASLNDKIEIAIRLKATNRDFKLLEYMDGLQKAVNNTQVERYHWAQLMVHPQYSLCLNVIAACMPSSERDVFLNTISKLKAELKPHIERLSCKQPLITSNMLKEQGIVPGIVMGQLLKEAERLAINEDIHDEQAILARLTQHPLWKSNV